MGVGGSRGRTVELASGICVLDPMDPRDMRALKERSTCANMWQGYEQVKTTAEGDCDD